MYYLKFVNQYTNDVFKEMKYDTFCELLEMINELNFRIEDEIVFLDENLKTISASFIRLIPFNNRGRKGFKLLFRVRMAEEQKDVCDVIKLSK